MDNTINNLFIRAIGAECRATIQVAFYGRSDLIDFPADSLEFFKSDLHVRDIIDPETGEVIFTRDL